MMMRVAKAAQAPPSMRSNSKKVYVPKMGDWASTQLVAILKIFSWLTHFQRGRGQYKYRPWTMI